MSCAFWKHPNASIGVRCSARFRSLRSGRLNAPRRPLTAEGHQWLSHGIAACLAAPMVCANTALHPLPLVGAHCRVYASAAAWVPQASFLCPSVHRGPVATIVDRDAIAPRVDSGLQGPFPFVALKLAQERASRNIDTPRKLFLLCSARACNEWQGHAETERKFSRFLLLRPSQPCAGR